MECVQCGEHIRPNARYCNNCGAAQTPQTGSDAADISTSTTPPPTPVSQTPSPIPASIPASSADAHDTPGPDDDPSASGERLKRPPRTLRNTEPLTVSSPAAMRAIENAATAIAGEGDVSAASPTPKSASAPDAWADADTVESLVMPGLPRFTPTPSSLPVVGDSSDGLPWPLPLSIIVGGRYRVEALDHAAPDDPGAENIYRVSDLQGYERCWSCRKEYGVTGAADRFCRECGADMLAREFLMYERRATAGPSDNGATGATDAAPASDAPPPPADPDERRFTQGARVYRVAPRITDATPFSRGARILIGAASDVGISRSGDRNEDSLGAFLVNLGHDSHLQPLALGIVADGLGGHINGQDASRLVTRLLTEHVVRSVALPLIGLPADAKATEEGLGSVLVEGARSANLALCNANTESEADMGSTLVAALLFGATAYIINVGDSRAYALDETGLRRITTDHSLVEQLIAGGFVQPEERYSHPQRNQIYRSMGDDPSTQIDIFVQTLHPGIRLLLCSDGLWEMTRDDELERILREQPDPQLAAEALIASANEHGGEDNITAVVIAVYA